MLVSAPNGVDVALVNEDVLVDFSAVVEGFVADGGLTSSTGVDSMDLVGIVRSGINLDVDET